MSEMVRSKGQFWLVCVALVVTIACGGGGTTETFHANSTPGALRRLSSLPTVWSHEDQEKAINTAYENLYWWSQSHVPPKGGK